MAALLELALRRVAPDQLDPTGEAGPAVVLARLAGIPRRSAVRLIAAGDLSHVQADRLAVAMGYMPWEVWPEWRDFTTDEAAADARTTRSEARRAAA